MAIPDRAGNPARRPNLPGGPTRPGSLPIPANRPSSPIGLHKPRPDLNAPLNLNSVVGPAVPKPKQAFNPNAIAGEIGAVRFNTFSNIEPGRTGIDAI